MEENNQKIIDKTVMTKYLPEDIDRIFNERVQTVFIEAKLKPGLICEWTFKYPNGNITAQCEGSWAINPDNNDVEIAKRVIIDKIKDRLWDIIGKYTLATGEMM